MIDNTIRAHLTNFALRHGAQTATHGSCRDSGFTFSHVTSSACTLSALYLTLASTISLAQGSETDIANNDDSNDRVEETVVVASRTPDLIDQIGVSVTVLDQGAMRAFG